MKIKHFAIIAATLPTFFGACDGAVSGDQAATAPPVLRQVSRTAAERFQPLLPERLRATYLGATPSVGAPPAPLTQAEVCAARTERIATEVDAAREAAGACSSDAECTTSWANVKCDTVRGDVWAISFAGSAGFERAVAAIEAAQCAGWDPAAEADACPVVVVDWFSPLRSVCVEGMCQVDAGDMTCSEPDDTGAAPLGVVDTREGCLDCQLAASKARQALTAAVAEVDGCAVDADCAIVSDFTGCDAGCGVAVNVAAAGGWGTVLDSVSAGYCSANGACPIAMPGCLPTRAVCNAGTCGITADDSWGE